ncbi:FAD-binding oxidoreductase [Limibaculum sp. M0105]|uniref:FAD-binding oxidoreductase n=1 Tax=Thermohalobaculum xanthum TaxID=2753746 RepID=A0A8J7SCD7_9RHOB|nr:FAD-binding oxidoreductase [Thermohalobaculum xanthum]MBK0398638.1 FAD-binding oxidoreductase [Thermohalobaculum xanthum]
MTSYLTANDRPGQHPRSWYADTAGPMPDHPALAGEARADVCVVGGGYAGLSAALHLAERGYSVVLLEANRIGWGASGRNGGQLGTGPRQDIRAYEAKIGRDDARKVWDIAIAANRLVRELIARHGIDCNLTDGGLEAAWKPGHATEMAEYADHVSRHYGRDDLKVIDRAAMADWLGTGRYHGGLYEGMYAHLHPLRLALGIGHAAAAAGARLHELSRVTRVSPGRVETEDGAVTADHVILAMNGYLDGLVPAVQARSMPINNFIAVTEPLGQDRAAQIIKGPYAVSDTKFVLNYYRMTPDHRLLWGGGESYGARFPSDIAGLVRSKMLEIFPQLSDAALTHAWGGTLAITAPRMPIFQRVDPQTLAISGWSGSGIHMATMGGLIAAEAIAGQSERWDAMARLPIPAFPGGEWFRAPLLALAMTWYSLRDRL